MIDKLLFDNTAFTLERAAGGASRRQGVLAHNIANVNTPGFIRQEFSFKEALADALDESGAEGLAERQRIEAATPTSFEDSGPDLRMDGNNVDIDSEMAQLSRNGIEYGAYMRLLGDKITLMRTVIQGR